MFGLSFRRSDPELSQDLFLVSHTDFMGKCRDSLWKPDSFHGLYGFFWQAGGLVVGHLLPLVLGTSLFPTSA